jgi:hypothetical protein
MAKRSYQFTWQKISWKKFLILTIFLFAFTLLAMIVWNYFDQEEKVINLFSSKELFRRAFLSTLLGFVFSCLKISDNDSSKKG